MTIADAIFIFSLAGPAAILGIGIFLARKRQKEFDDEIAQSKKKPNSNLN